MARSRQAGKAGRRELDINYLFLRQQTERSRAATASSEVARKIYEQLADEYERLIANATEGRVTFVHAGRGDAREEAQVTD